MFVVSADRPSLSDERVSQVTQKRRPLPAEVRYLWAACGLALLFLVLHLPYLPTDPGGIDSANFALGVRDFNVANHQPHPPGYPVFIALGRLSNAVLSYVQPQQHAEARALAFWSTIAGALTAIPLFVFFKQLERDPRVAVAAAAVTMTCPLFWFSGVRAMSDIPGLAAALVPQALLLTALRREAPASQRPGSTAAPATLPGSPETLLVVSAAIVGFAIGLRSQTAWLTVPLLVLALMGSLRRLDYGPVLRAGGAFAVGVLAWAIPLVVASGGVSGYLDTLGRQSLEDFSDVDLLVTNLTLERLWLGVERTLGFPWGDLYVGVAVLSLAAVGFVAMALRARVALGLLAVAAVPYAVFHLLFQDSMLTRYALPLVPAVAYLALRGVSTFSPRAIVPAAVVLSMAGLWIAMPPVVTFASVGNPAQQALRDIQARLARSPEVHPVLAAHQSVALALRAGALPSPTLPSPPKREWLEVVKYWTEGGTAPVWFLAEPQHTDLAIVDPRSWSRLGDYEWTLGHHTLVSGVRPDKVAWFEILQPSWFVGDGWSLSLAWHAATIAGRLGPGKQPIVAHVRRRPERAMLMLGGRNMGSRGDRDARIEVTLDGRLLDAWTVPPENRPFLFMRELPAGLLTGTGSYAALEVRASPVEGGTDRPTQVVVEQFDVQASDAPLIGYGPDWYEGEFNAPSRVVWRWMGSRGTLRAYHGGQDRTLHLRVDVPIEHLAATPTIRIMVGTHELARLSVAPEMTFALPVPARLLDEAGGLITIETDRTFVPAEVLGSNDPRSLGLRMFELALR